MALKCPSCNENFSYFKKIKQCPKCNQKVKIKLKMGKCFGICMIIAVPMVIFKNLLAPEFPTYIIGPIAFIPASFLSYYVEKTE